MTPLSFEWQWSADYFIFMGLLYLALIIVGCGLVYSFMRTWLDLHYDEGPTEAPPELAYRSKYSEY
jgi:hypothetical protein